jgi:hypothetical protein
LTYLKTQDCIKQQALKQGDILKHIRVHGAQHDDIQIELFCFTFLKGQYCIVNTVEWRADEIVLTMGIDFKCSSELLQQFERDEHEHYITCQGVEKCQRTLALKRQGEKGYKDRLEWYVAVLMEVKTFIHWKVWKTTLLEGFGALSI